MGKLLLMLIEDDAELRMLLATVLEDCGHSVVLAENGQDALAKLEHVHPDALLLDLRMPVMNGWEFVRRAKERFGAVPPTVLMTADRGAQRWADELGAIGSVAKPFSLEALLEVLEPLHPSAESASRALPSEPAHPS